MKYIFIVLATLLLVSGCSVCNLEKTLGDEVNEVSVSVLEVGKAIGTGDSQAYLSLVDTNSGDYQNQALWINYWNDNEYALNNFEYNILNVYYDTGCTCLRSDVEVTLSISNETYTESYSELWYMAKLNNKWMIY